LSLLADEAERQSVDDRVDALQNCLDGLADHQVELLETCYLCSDGVQIVARSRGIEPSAVYMRLHRLRKALMECIERRMALELNEQPSVSE
jgi:DNA-directed RNA polymerase specialized sigma24 family protein